MNEEIRIDNRPVSPHAGRRAMMRAPATGCWVGDPDFCWARRRLGETKRRLKSPAQNLDLCGLQLHLQSSRGAVGHRAADLGDPDAAGRFVEHGTSAAGIGPVAKLDFIGGPSGIQPAVDNDLARKALLQVGVCDHHHFLVVEDPGKSDDPRGEG